MNDLTYVVIWYPMNIEDEDVTTVYAGGERDKALVAYGELMGENENAIQLDVFNNDGVRLPKEEVQEIRADFSKNASEAYLLTQEWYLQELEDEANDDEPLTDDTIVHLHNYGKIRYGDIDKLQKR